MVQTPYLELSQIGELTKEFNNRAWFLKEGIQMKCFSE